LGDHFGKKKGMGAGEISIMEAMMGGLGVSKTSMVKPSVSGVNGRIYCFQEGLISITLNKMLG